MSGDPAERFIEAAVRPLGDNAELQIAGRRLLEEAMADAGEGDEGAVENADRQHSRNAHSRVGRHWRMILNVVAFAVFAWVAVAALLYLRSIKPLAQTISAMAGESSGGEADYRQEDRIGAKLAPAERLLLFGDDSQESNSLRWKALWDSDPENAAFFADYALAYIEEHKDLPPDFLATGERLDPGNGWFPTIAAGVLADQAADPLPRTDEDKKAKVPLTYDLKDEAKLGEVLAYLSKAAAMPRFDSYQRELLEARVVLLPRGSDTFDRIPAMIYMVTTRSPMMPLRQLHGALHAECDRITRSGNREALERLVHDWDTVARRIAESGDFTVMDVLLKYLAIQEGYKVLAKVSVPLKLENSDRLQRIADKFRAHRKAMRSLASQRGNFRDRAGLLAGMSLPMISKQALKAPEIRDKDLKPGRLAEHEFLAKALAACMAGLMAVLAAVVAMYRFRGGELRRRLSEQLADVLGPADWGGILGAGVVLPFLAVQIIARLPVLGARELSIHAAKYLPTCGLYSLGIWLLILLPVLIARWRLMKRARFMGVVWRHSWIGWIIALPLVLSVPFVAIALLPKNLSMPVTVGFAVISQAAQLWFWVVALRGLFSRQEHLLKRVTLSRAVFPAYVLGMLLMAIAALVSHRLEKHWIQKDRLMEVTFDEPSTSRYEYQVTQALRQEILGILETE